MPGAPPQTAAPADFKPHVFGKFFLLQRMAIGGMAEIYRAKVRGAGGFEKELVVKRILPSRAEDEGFIKMLVNEAKLTVQLTHNNVAQIYECGAIDGKFFIAMELVHGVSMKDVMAAFPKAGVAISPEQAIFMVLQLLQGLDYAHKKTDPQGHALKIVHCDVSPDNALVSYEGEVKLTDFGIARAATGLSNYKEGMLMGKLGYVAPEQASIEQTWDHRVDVFAAGIILYELLTRQKPFPRATDVESLVESRKAKVVPPSGIDPRIPKELDAILMRAVAYDPEKRYPDARVFADALVDVLFPTPQSAVQGLLGSQMQKVFAEHVAKQRAARGHDALVMKVLVHVAEQSRPVYQKFTDTSPGELPAAALPDPLAEPPELEPIADEAAVRPKPRAAAPRVRRVFTTGVSVARAMLVGLLAGLCGAAALLASAVWLLDGTLLVTSSPSGAAIALDGEPTGKFTPAALEGVRLSRPHAIELSAPDVRPSTVEVPARVAGHLVRVVHAELEPVLGDLVVASDPPGAAVRVDDRPVGTTPVTVAGVRRDQRHRIDLTLAGHELDQFVVVPEKDGSRFKRRLTPLADAHRARRADR